ncbi:MAG: hypothetical protein JST83_10935 [Bacteroidetes bacterium]|nr:hypothetical protein [Bacteroidota bacterium]
MKTFILILTLLISVLHGYCQSEMTIPQQQLPSAQPESVMRLRTAPDPYTHQYNENFQDMCIRYKAVKTSGLVLSVLGGGLIVTGAALLPHIHTLPGQVTEYAQTVNTRQRTAAKAAIVVGALSVAAGIPMITFGAIRSRRACGSPARGRSGAKLNLQTGENGAGMALQF